MSYKKNKRSWRLGGLDAEKYTIKNLLLSKLNRKLTLLFIIVALIAPSLGIYYFYIISISSFPNDIYTEQAMLLRTVAIMVVIVIAIDGGIIGYLVSRSISKPINELYKATCELEKGNYDIKTDIKTNDEIAKLGNAFNETTSALAKLQNERLEIDKAKTEFLSITSHELRSPMTPMKAQLQMLQQGYFGNLTEKQLESLNIIIRNSDRLDNIIADFLEISRIEAARLKFNFQMTDINQTVTEITKFMSGFAKEKNIELVQQLNKLPTIEIDPDRLSQVIRNLINNAIKFSPHESKIIISAEQRDDYILFGVRDFGCGLSSENQIRIFEPFFQVESANKRRYGGTGLGLAICRGIVESQKGKIWVESKMGKGCKFFFTIPLVPVRNVEPIKVLFSQKSTIERKINEEFKTVLGPLGDAEFNDLKIKNALNKEDLNKYIDSLTNQYIIPNNTSMYFKSQIRKIFGEEKLFLKQNREVIK